MKKMTGLSEKGYGRSTIVVFISLIFFLFTSIISLKAQAAPSTNTPTKTATRTPTKTPTRTPTKTPTKTPSNTSTLTRTNTATKTSTNTPTLTPTNTFTNSPTNTPTISPTNSPTNSPTFTQTLTPTITPSDTATNTQTDTPTNSPTPVSFAVWTQHNDNGRTGADLQETQLNITNLASSFGLEFTCPVDDQIYAQPLYIPSVINGQNVVYVATVNDTVYAFNADTGASIWQKNLIPTGERVPHGNRKLPGPNLNSDVFSDVGGPCYYPDINGNLGILGTPVIDLSTNTMFLVARTVMSGTDSTISSNHKQRLYALDITTGNVLRSVEITGSVTSPIKGNISFDPRNENQRAAIGFYNNKVYIAWASHGDNDDLGPYHGWIMEYDATSFTQLNVFNTTSDYVRGGVWMSGQGPSIDTTGNVFFQTGNSFLGSGPDGTQQLPGPYPAPGSSITNLGNSIVKLNGDLKLQDSFTPCNFTYLDTGGKDLDLGSAGCVLIPGTQLLLGGGKECKFYLVDSTGVAGMPTKMGGYQNPAPVCSDVVKQEFSVNDNSDNQSHHIHGSPIYWNGPNFVYVWPENDDLKAYPFDAPSQQFSSTTAVGISSVPRPPGMPGGILSLSADSNDPANTGIVWASVPTADAEHGGYDVPLGNGILRAFKAMPNSGTLTELWDSEMNSSRDRVGLYAKFVPPTVAKGRVYLATFSNQLDVYGLNPTSSGQIPPVTPTPIPCCQFDPSWPVPQPIFGGGGQPGLAVNVKNGWLCATDSATNSLRIYQVNGGVGVTPISGLPGPTAITADPSPNSNYMYVACGNGAVYKVDVLNGTVGAPLHTVGGGVVLSGISVDGAGNIYLTAYGNKVYILDPLASYTEHIMTSNINGTPFNNPKGILKLGNILYVVDGGNNRIVKYTELGPGSTPFAYDAGVLVVNYPSCASPYGLAADAGSFYVSSFDGGYRSYDRNWLNPYHCYPGGIMGNGFGIAVDGTGVYATDQQSKLFKFSLCNVHPVFTPTPYPTADCCQTDLVFNGVNFTYDACVDSKYLYVADGGNNQIAIYDKLSGAAPVAVINNTNHVNLGFNSPMGVALDGLGHLFVSDASSMTNYEFDTTSPGYPLLTTFQGIVGAPFGIWANSGGTTVLVTEGENQRGIKVYQKQGTTYTQVMNLVPTSNPNFVPIGIAGDAAGYVYVADSENIVWKYNSADFTQTPTQINLTGIGGAKYISIDSFGDFYVTDNLGGYVVYNPDWTVKNTCTSANGTAFSNPTGIAVDGVGSIYVCCFVQDRVVKMKSCNDLVFPTPTATSTPTATPNCCLYDLVFNGTSHPQDLKVDATNVYVGDGGNSQVAIYSQTALSGSGPSAVISGSGLNSPAGVALDGLGHLFVSDIGTDKFYEFQNTTGYPLVGTFTDGLTGLAGTTGQLIEPRGIWANSAGTTIVVTEFQGHTFRVFTGDPSTGIYSTVYKLAPTGFPNFFPMGITGDAAGNVYVVDLENIVWIYNSANFTQTPVQVNVTGINQSKYISIDNSGNFYLSDTNNQYVVYNPDWTVKTSCGSANGMSFNQPQGIGVDATGRIYVGDQYNNRIVRMLACTIPQPSRSAPRLSSGQEGATPTPNRTASPTWTPTPTVTATPTLQPDTLRMVAAPNVSRNGEPIQFRITVGQPASVDLILFTLLGEQVYQASLPCNTGDNTLTWGLKNQAGLSVASGLYFYQIRVKEEGSMKTQRGKVAILH